MEFWQASPTVNLAIEYDTNKMITLQNGEGLHIEQDAEFVNQMRIGILPEDPAISDGVSSDQVPLLDKLYGVNEFEKEEIKKFPKIYTFGGQKAARSPPFTFNGFYQLYLEEHIAYRYTVKKFAGAGTYSQVTYCEDCKTGKQVAIKVNRKASSYLYGETKMLLFLQQKDPESKFLPKLLDFGMFRGHLYLVLEPFQTNLHCFISENQNMFSENDVIKMMKSLIRGLIFLAQNDIIHADLKSTNILLNSDDCGKLKIADFGLAVQSSHAERGHVVQSCAFRAPEVFCGGRITCAIDMWSLGCILMELTACAVIPRPAADDAQFFVLLQMFGLPPPEFFRDCVHADKYFTDHYVPLHCFYAYNARNEKVLLVNKNWPDCSQYIGPPGATPFSTFIRTDRTRMIPLMIEMFQWTPSKRISPTTALYHHALNNEHDSE